MSIKHTLVSALFGALLTAPAWADESGQIEYNNNCASCHGAMGVGDGPMVGFLTLRPTDLTRLSQNNDGEFPMYQVIQMIDGRTIIPAHGREMPIWGGMFKGEAEGGAYAAEIETRGRILSIAYYLESIQK